MKKPIVLLIVFACLGLYVYRDEINLTSASAQDAGSELWLEDFQLAQSRARATNRPILILFTGSDWCPPCMNLERNVFSTKHFEQFARENLVLYVADFPRRKRQPPELIATNQRLQQTYRIRGYPTLVLVNAQGRQLDQFGYGGQNANAFVNLLAQKVRGNRS
ncbi:MAG: thioredoxin family protein [Verrucomicrobia bacterium]|nr:thioredoxin family protein [Verrucomicrobiota bacterium]MCH8513131.1 thioredoxin family protein [Kiritimatiellia bacterium]